MSQCHFSHTFGACVFACGGGGKSPSGRQVWEGQSGGGPSCPIHYMFIHWEPAKTDYSLMQSFPLPC